MPILRKPNYKKLRQKRLQQANLDPVETKRNNLLQSFYYSLFAAAGLTALFLIIFGFISARDTHKKEQANFNLENISIETTEPITARFVKTNEPQDFTFPFTVTNHSRYDYKIFLSGKILDTGLELEKTEGIDLPAGKTKTIELTIPLTFASQTNEAGSQHYTLKLKIATKIAANQLLGSLFKDFEKEFPINLELARDKDLAEVAIAPINKSLTYSDNSYPTLNMNLTIKNQVSFPHEFSIYEIFLTNTDKKRIQPLIASKTIVKARETKTVPVNFVFKLPPGNQLVPGSQNYLLEFVYTGNIGSRNFTLTTFSKETLTINVK